MKVAAVVVLYNPDENVKKNIKSYINSVDVVYAVDNSSQDNSENFSDDKIVYLSNGDNMGIAYALNVGAKKAIEDGHNVIGGVNENNWPKLYKAIKEKNVLGKDGIVEHVNRPDVGKDRNDWAKRTVSLIKF